MNDDVWTWLVRVAGVLHVVALAAGWYAPIPPDWDKHLAALPPINRRFAIAQNAFVGAVQAAAGIISLCFAATLTGGETGGRIICACIALWWTARLVVLRRLEIGEHLSTWWMRSGFAALQVGCVACGLGYGWLAVR